MYRLWLYGNRPTHVDEPQIPLGPRRNWGHSILNHVNPKNKVESMSSDQHNNPKLPRGYYRGFVVNHCDFCTINGCFAAQESTTPVHQAGCQPTTAPAS